LHAEFRFGRPQIRFLQQKYPKSASWQMKDPPALSNNTHLNEAEKKGEEP
jgi:hypothetical protein